MGLSWDYHGILIPKEGEIWEKYGKIKTSTAEHMLTEALGHAQLHTAAPSASGLIRGGA
jgi:hypothetical protein